jgi:hypothetical protein
MVAALNPYLYQIAGTICKKQSWNSWLYQIVQTISKEQSCTDNVTSDVHTSCDHHTIYCHLTIVHKTWKKIIVTTYHPMWTSCDHHTIYCHLTIVHKTWKKIIVTTYHPMCGNPNHSCLLKSKFYIGWTSPRNKSILDFGNSCI